MKWKDTCMKLLECFEDEEGTWYKAYWYLHGISDADKAKIEKAYVDWLARKAGVMP